MWDYRYDPDDSFIVFSLESPDGDNGYPGSLNASVKYTVTDNNELKLEYRGKIDKATIFSPTNHIYFNLAGHQCSTPDHLIKLYCSHHIPFDRNMHSTGKILPITESLLKLTQDYDHYFVADNKGFCLIAEISEGNSGTGMKVYTDQPGMVLYATNELIGVKGKNNADYGYRGWFCVEPRSFPICPSQKLDAESILQPEDEYYQKTVLKFYI